MPRNAQNSQSGALDLKAWGRVLGLDLLTLGSGLFGDTMSLLSKQNVTKK